MELSIAQLRISYFHFRNFIKLLEFGQMLFTIMRYDIYILRERTLKKNSFLSLKMYK